MRLVAWNCCGTFSAKVAHLAELDFDVAVVAECGPFAVPPHGNRTWTWALTQPVITARKHLGVFARQPWSVHPMPQTLPWLLAADVAGPTPSTLLAVWPVRDLGTYAGQTARVIAEVLPTLTGPVVLAGDLNAPIATSARAHAANVAALDAAGLVSAFTATRSTEPLAEPTFYQNRRREQAFHIDHVFVPRAWTSGLRLEIGTYDTWVATGRSDHVPLIVDADTSDLGERT